MMTRWRDNRRSGVADLRAECDGIITSPGLSIYYYWWTRSPGILLSHPSRAEVTKEIARILSGEGELSCWPRETGERTGNNKKKHTEQLGDY